MIHQPIPQDRTLYLELAKLRPRDRKWLKDNLKQVARLLKKEIAPVESRSRSKIEITSR